MSDYLQDPYTVYEEYCAIKAHFTTKNYDYVKFNGKLKSLSLKSFENRKDKMFFHYLAREYSRAQSVSFFISQFIENDSAYIGDFIFNKEESIYRYKKWNTRISMIWENYKADLFNLTSSYKDWKSILLSQEECSHPPIFSFMIKKQITPETYVLLDKLFGFINKNMDILKDDMIFNQFNFKYKKYNSFIICDRKKIALCTPKLLT